MANVEEVSLFRRRRRLEIFSGRAKYRVYQRVQAIKKLVPISHWIFFNIRSIDSSSYRSCKGKFADISFPIQFRDRSACTTSLRSLKIAYYIVIRLHTVTHRCRQVYSFPCRYHVIVRERWYIFNLAPVTFIAGLNSSCPLPHKRYLWKWERSAGNTFELWMCNVYILARMHILPRLRTLSRVRRYC